MRRLFYFVLLLAFCISSCSIERRHYRPGFYVEQHTRKNTVAAEPVTARAEEEPEIIPGKVTPAVSEDLLAAADSSSATPAVASHKSREQLQAAIAQAQHQVLRKAEPARRLAQKANKGQPLPEDISTALGISFLMLVIFGSATVLFLSNPAAVLESSDGDTIWILASPMFTMLFIFFIPGLIRKCVRAMRKEPRGSKARILGTLAVLLCVLCAALSIGTFIYLLMNPDLFVIVAIAAALALLVGLIEAIL